MIRFDRRHVLYRSAGGFAQRIQPLCCVVAEIYERFALFVLHLRHGVHNARDLFSVGAHTVEHDVGICLDLFADGFVFVFHIPIGDGENDAQLIGRIRVLRRFGQLAVKRVDLSLICRLVVLQLLDAVLIVRLARFCFFQLLPQGLDLLFVHVKELFAVLHRTVQLFHRGFQRVHLVGERGIVLIEIVEIVVCLLAIVPE